MNNTLQHYGVLGMKWGKRKANTTVVSKTNGRNVNSETSQHKPKKIITTKQKQKMIQQQAKTMSDKELRDKINRMQMEQQYIRMMTPEKSAGRKQVEQFLINEGRVLASQMLRDELRKNVKK